jgi:hypothetical protein
MSTAKIVTFIGENGSMVVNYPLMEQVVAAIRERNYFRMPCWPTKERPVPYNPTKLWAERMIWMDERIERGEKFPELEILWQIGVQRELVRRALAYDPVNDMIRGQKFYEDFHRGMLERNAAIPT